MNRIQPFETFFEGLLSRATFFLFPQLYQEVNQQRPDLNTLEVLRFICIAHWKIREYLVALYGLDQLEKNAMVELINLLLYKHEYREVSLSRQEHFYLNYETVITYKVKRSTFYGSTIIPKLESSCKRDR